MLKNQAIGTTVAVAGFVILIVGSIGYMGVVALGEALSCVLMGIGIVAVIGALIALTVMMRTKETAPKEE